MAKIKINVFRDGGEWFGARWIDDDYDGCDVLPCAADAPEHVALATARSMSLRVRGKRTVVRVPDIT